MTVAPINKQYDTQASSASSASQKTSSVSFQSVLDQATKPVKSAAEQLADYVNMTPAQRMRADILNKLGLTEEEVAAMSPAEQKAVEAKIAELMKQEIAQQQQSNEKKGQRLDISA